MKTQTYSVTVTTNEEGKMHMTRINDGFDVLQLMGLCSMLQYELGEQFKGFLKPDHVTRQVIVDEPKTTQI